MKHTLSLTQHTAIQNLLNEYFSPFVVFNQSKYGKEDAEIYVYGFDTEFEAMDYYKSLIGKDAQRLYVAEKNKSISYIVDSESMKILVKSEIKNY